MARRNENTEASGVIVELLSRIVQLAVNNHASDVHIEPEHDIVRIRFRIDGILREIEKHPLSLLPPLVSRVKVLAEMDIAERRKPQDGRFQITVTDRSLDVRVSTFPTLWGENIVLRLLDKASLVLGLEQLGMNPAIMERYQQMVRTPYGSIFVTGPNGSGKTTTLYSTLNTINSVEKNIATLEDPVEYQMPLIRQTQIDPEAGLTFASGLRALLRQDPDIILVGEIRDTETGEIAVRAALTGHLVLSTVHTNDSIGAISRLSDMGIEPLLIASSTIGVLAQRLVRLVCQACREPYQPEADVRQRLNAPSGATFYRARGCEQCGMTGYTGRIAIFELLEPSSALRKLITGRAPYETIADQARQDGMRTLRDDGVDKAQQGLTTLEEIYRVTSANPNIVV